MKSLWAPLFLKKIKKITLKIGLSLRKGGFERGRTQDKLIIFDEYPFGKDGAEIKKVLLKLKLLKNPFFYSHQASSL